MAAPAIPYAPTPAPRWGAAVLAAIVAFYPACVAWYLLLGAASRGLFAIMVPLHFLGAGDATQAIASTWTVVRMTAAAPAASWAFALVVALLVAVWIARRAPVAPLGRRLRWALAALALAAALAIDAVHIVTPVGAALASSAPATPIVASREVAVAEWVHLKDRDVGQIARTAGVLGYSERMRRFHLADPANPNVSIVVHARRDRDSWIADLLAEGVDRRVEDRLRPLVAQRVIVTGTITRNGIGVRASDVVPVPDAPIAR